MSEALEIFLRLLTPLGVFAGIVTAYMLARRELPSKVMVNEATAADKEADAALKYIQNQREIMNDYTDMQREFLKVRGLVDTLGLEVNRLSAANVILTEDSKAASERAAASDTKMESMQKVIDEQQKTIESLRKQLDEALAIIKGGQGGGGTASKQGASDSRKPAPPSIPGTGETVDVKITAELIDSEGQK